MQIFFDTEFFDTGDSIYLLSLGAIRSDGQIYYAEVIKDEWPIIPADDWVSINVLPHLTSVCPKSKAQIAEEFRPFAGNNPEFLAFVASWDWILLTRLYGLLVNRPDGWPKAVMDCYCLPHFRRYLVKPDQPHNALSDAIALKKSYDLWNQSWREE